jgi:hypothetical protein
MEKEPNEAIGGLNDLYEFERLMRTKKWMVVSERAFVMIKGVLVLKPEDNKTLAYFETRFYGTPRNIPLKMIESTMRTIHVVRKTEELYNFFNYLLKGALTKEEYDNIALLDIDLESKKVKALFAKNEEELNHIIEIVEKVMSEP